MFSYYCFGFIIPCSIRAVAVRPYHPWSCQHNPVFTRYCHASVCCSLVAPSPSPNPSAIAQARYGVIFTFVSFFAIFVYLLAFDLYLHLKHTPYCGVCQESFKTRPTVVCLSFPMAGIKDTSVLRRNEPRLYLAWVVQ